MAMWAGTAGAQSVLYVDAAADTAPHDGSSWCRAYTDLQAALAAAVPGTTLRVADGVYTPAGPNGNRAISFELRNGVALLGGYPGCGAPDPDARDPELYLTILSGDLNGDDDTGGDNSENAYHVVRADGVNETSVLDGFVITGGNANSANNPDDRGAGIFLYPTPSNPTIRGCVIRGNVAAARGGGFYGAGNTGTIVDCLLEDNRANEGGAMYNVQGGPTVSDCTFRNNRATAVGGAVFNTSSDPTFQRCTFEGNAALGGGGIHNTLSSQTSIRECLFRRNAATGSPGTPSGGGIYSQSSELLVMNTAFNGNSADASGGGFMNVLGNVAHIENTVFTANTAGISGGGLRHGGGTVVVVNSIFWENIANGAANESAQIRFTGGTLNVSYSCVQGLTGLLGGMGNIGTAPLFVDATGSDGEPGTADDDLRLALGSPCINTGSPAFAGEPGATDLDGQPRVQGCRVDMGPYESNSTQAFGDFDASGAVNFADAAALQVCFGGDPFDPGWLDTCLCVFDADESTELDLADYEAFRQVFILP